MQKEKKNGAFSRIWRFPFFRAAKSKKSHHELFRLFKTFERLQTDKKRFS